MKRVYRLLRDNLESGPYTIDELLGQQLKSDDMLWIEGRSTAWCYLSEIELSLSIEPDSSSKKLPVSRRDDIEMRADEIRKKVLNFKPQNLPVREEIGDRGEKHYYIPISPVDTIEMVDHRKPKKTLASDLVMTSLIVGLFAGGFLGGRALFMNKKQVASVPAPVTRSVSKDDHAAKSSKPAIGNEPVASFVPVDSTLLTSLTKKKTVSTKKTFDSNRVSERITAITLRERDTNTVQDVEEPANAGPADNGKQVKDQKTDPEPVKQIKPVNVSNEIAKDETVEKKPGIFKKIFGKKKKNGPEEN
jgi:hypothetical protein